MLREYIFSNALKLKWEIKSKESIYYPEISYIPITTWVPLVDSYTSIELPEYSIPNMLQMFVDGKVPLTVGRMQLENVEYGPVKINAPSNLPWKTRRNFWDSYAPSIDFTMHRTVLFDDMAYKSAMVFYFSYNNELAVKEFVLINGKRANRLSLLNPKLGADAYRVTFFAGKYLSEKHGLEWYRILPKPTEGEFMVGCLEKKNIKVTISKMPIVVKDLGEYNKYIFPLEFAKELTWEYVNEAIQ